jgi:Arc/MetJ-type ribon-helix-helix transcriptional regulator|tara:strand:+ start:415 stop:543 length:129 start_codon:yes stop_codon:yes gene_type:complete
MKTPISITIDDELNKELDKEVENEKFRNKSHAVEFYIKRGKR